jgi:hypothetical protein
VEVVLQGVLRMAMRDTRAPGTWESSYSRGYVRFADWCAARIPPRQALSARPETVRGSLLVFCVAAGCYLLSGEVCLWYDFHCP